MPGDSYVSHARKHTWQGPRPTWGAPRKKIEDKLTLAEVVILRRIRGGERQVDVARALGMTSKTVDSRLRQARRRFNVATTADLLELPRVVELLEGGDGD